jgi:hypothetical protein
MLRLIDHNNKHTTASAIQSINIEFIFARYITVKYKHISQSMEELTSLLF